jgi:hexosaminidase
LIGWDEILEGGIAPNATVMSWRGITGGIAAAKAGHDVVMTPTTYCYFDKYQSKDKDKEPLAIGGYLPVKMVYKYEPVPAELSEAEQKHILGAQGNVWTEYIKTPAQVEYMIFPRMLALAEVDWTPLSMRHWHVFKQRLRNFQPKLDEMGINYAPSIFKKPPKK